jgi:hypothetical protein
VPAVLDVDEPDAADPQPVAATSANPTSNHVLPR